MNIPFRFELSTDSGSGFTVGRLFEYLGDGIDYAGNMTLTDIASAAGLGANATARLRAAGIVIPTIPFYVVGFSLTAWYSADIGAKVDVGVWDDTNNVFIPLYECVSTGVAAGGLARTFMKYESGIFVPKSATLIPAIRASKQTGTHGPVTVCGDFGIIANPQ